MRSSKSFSRTSRCGSSSPPSQVFEWLMQKRTLMLVSAFACAAPIVSARIAETPDIRKLFVQLNDPKSTDRATRKIVELASKDSEARKYVVDRLPGMIAKSTTNEIRENGVRLAGQLRAVELVPSLVRAMARG